jgi:hypothetical protein
MGQSLDQRAGAAELSLEDIRRSYRPQTIHVLFVGESPPAGGTFFYSANSNLFRYTNEAFEVVCGPVCGTGDSFLRFFQSRGCYLDDLCLEPVNRLRKPARRLKHRQGVQALAERIEAAQPRAFVVVMKAIEGYVRQAIRLARAGDRPAFFLPFPAQANQRRYVDGLVAALRQLRQAKILVCGRAGE